MKNKAGKTSGLMIAGFVALIAILGFLAYGQSQSVIGGSGTDVVGNGAGCNIDPVVTVTATNALNHGSTVTVGTAAIVNGTYIGQITSGTTKFAEGQKVKLLLNATNYLDTEIPEFTISCSSNPVTADIYATDSMSLSIKDDAGTSVLTDSATGGAVNESAFSAGGSKTWEIQITGKDKESSGDLIYVVELGSEANVSSVTMSDSSGNALTKLSSVPSGLTTSGSNLYRVAFRIPAVKNAVKKSVFLNVAAASSKTISGAVYTTAYSEQAFVESDGTFTSGVADSDGNTKYEDAYDYDFYVTA